MDKQLNKLSSWLGFELLITIGGFGWYLFNYETFRPVHGNSTFYFILCVLMARIFLLSRAWVSLGGEPTVSTENEPEVPDDSTPIDLISED